MSRHEPLDTTTTITTTTTTTNNNNNKLKTKKLVAQDEAISTNYFKKKILKEEIESKCRLCKQHEETIEHLTSGCPILAKNKYLMRNDEVCTHFFLFIY